MAYSLGDLAERLGAELRGDPDETVARVATIAGAGPGSVTFLSNRKYRAQLSGTTATAVILSREFCDECPVSALVMDNPYLGYARAATLLAPPAALRAGVHASAVVSESASIDPTAWIGPNAVVEDDVEVAARVSLGPGCCIGESVRIGPDSQFGAHVVVGARSVVGSRVIVHPGVVIGADGFGIANDEGVWVKIPQLGRVVIGDDVEIGSNTCIDRGALDDTVIGNGVKLDNLIQVGHNVTIGDHTAIAACVAIGGSAVIGERCTIAGAASIAGHLSIVDDVHLTATSAVPNSIDEAGVYSSGMPIQDNRSWRRNIARLRNLDDMAKRLRALEREIK